MAQEPLFPSTLDSTGVVPVRGGTKRVLITVTTAPNPSDRHGETVCIAGIELGETGPVGWVRLYPMNLRELRSGGDGFRKYEVISVKCNPAVKDSRLESFNPDPSTLAVTGKLAGWSKRRPLVEPMIESSMCAIQRAASDDPLAPSLGLVRPVDVSSFRIEMHPGWNATEQAKIDAYVNQMRFDSDEERKPLEAPRFQAWYKWRCQESTCRGHEQGMLDWEFVALQRNLSGRSDDEAKTELRRRFFDNPFGSAKDPAIYVGNLVKRRHTFMVLGLYYPNKTD